MRNPVRRLFSPFISRILTKIFPKRVKRFILISSLFARITNQKRLDDETLSKLNQVFNLTNVSDNDGMLLPVMLQSLIWDEEEIEIVREYNASGSVTKTESCVSKVCEIIPTWLVYENFDADVRKLFNNFSLSPKVP